MVGGRTDVALSLGRLHPDLRRWCEGASCVIHIHVTNMEANRPSAEKVNGYPRVLGSGIENPILAEWDDKPSSTKYREKDSGPILRNVENKSLCRRSPP